MAPASHTASLRSLESATPPPSYAARTEPQPNQSHPRRIHTKSLRFTFFTTLIFLLLSLALALLVLIAGTAKASDAAILLQNFYVLHIPVKYPFLCQGLRQWECEPQWTIRMYLSGGVWAYHDVEGGHEPVHLLSKGVGIVFNLTNALTIMDETLALEDFGGLPSNRNYSIPTEPTRSVRAMTPMKTLIPFALILISMVLVVLIFVLWFSEWCAGLIKHKRVKLMRRRIILLLLGSIFGMSLAGAAYLCATASKAANQVAGNTTYISGKLNEANQGSKVGSLLAGVCVAQALAIIMYAIHARLEPKDEKVVEKTISRVEEGRNSRTRQTEEPPEYTHEPTDLDIIRITELQTLARLHARESWDSISEISRLSREMSRPSLHATR